MTAAPIDPDAERFRRTRYLNTFELAVRDGWRSKLDTQQIADALEVHQSKVANALGRLQDWACAGEIQL